MKSHLLHSLVAAAVCAGAAAASSAALLSWAPHGKAGAAYERWVLAPGGAVYERLHERKGFRKLQSAAEDALDSAREKAEELREKAAPADSLMTAWERSPKRERLAHLYNVSAWATVGFVLCLLFALFFGISSISHALMLGLKVTLTLACLQGALVFAGILAAKGG